MPEAKLIKIKELWLGCNNIGNKGVQLLTKADLPHLKTLSLGISHLYLVVCRLDDPACFTLSKGHWPTLTILSLNKLPHQPESKKISITSCWALR